MCGNIEFEEVGEGGERRKLCAAMDEFLHKIEDVLIDDEVEDMEAAVSRVLGELITMFCDTKVTSR